MQIERINDSPAKFWLGNLFEGSGLEQMTELIGQTLVLAQSAIEEPQV